MSGSEIQDAFARIDAALARIETASVRPPQADGELAARHERLRSAASQTLRQLDALIAEQSQ
jgi:hypothetical protein